MKATTPEDVDRLFGECVNAGDLEHLVALYEPGATLLLAEGALVGHAAIRAGLAPMLEAKLNIRMNVTKVVRCADDLAMLYNDWSMGGTAPDGQKVEMSGKAIEVVRRQRDGSWLFCIDDPNARG